MERRQFVKKMGMGSLALGSTSWLLGACSSDTKNTSNVFADLKSEDRLTLSNDLEFDFLIKELDPINEQMSFGAYSAGLAFLPQGDNEGYLWINHEMVSPFLSSGYDDTKGRHRKMIQTEMYRVGGTILKIERTSDDKWKPVIDDLDNYRVTGASKVPLVWDEPIEGFNSVVGTVANRGACLTPWGTFLTAERNYSEFYGEYYHETDERTAGELQWQSFYPKHHPHHFGWVVEIDPNTGSARKHIALGRMFHGDVTIRTMGQGMEVYSCDDRNGGCLYKYSAPNQQSFQDGRLYVANLDSGKWELIDKSRPELENFKDQTEVLIRTRLAADLVGGTALDAPSGLAIEKESGDLIVSVRGQETKGSIIRISDYGDTLDSEEIVKVEDGSDFVHPSTLCFGPDGRLWIGSSIPSSKLGIGDYNKLQNNALYVMDFSSEDEPVKMAMAPWEAEFAGMKFSENGKTLFLSVQHPGELTRRLIDLTSNWPGGGTTVPRSAVVCVIGSALNKN